MIEKIKKTFYESYTSDADRQRLMFKLMSLVLGAVSLIMSLMNIYTEEYALATITTSYSVLSIINFHFIKKLRIPTLIAFFAETTAMLSAFILTGVPGGFSLLWTLLIPACALSVFGREYGTAFSAVLFAVIVFFFWTPWGRELLLYEYSSVYMMRFPMVYICIYLISFYIEWIRRRTFEKLLEADRKYRWLYRHDALTGAYSRHAFYEELDAVLSDGEEHATATLMLDIDDFKAINDLHGHNFGDTVLCHLSDIVMRTVCEHSLFCRWGGEEFIILMHCDHDPFETAEKIRCAIAASEVVTDGGERVRYTVSLGISVASISSRDRFSEQVNRADKAMYISKAEGKNRTTVFG